MCIIYFFHIYNTKIKKKNLSHEQFLTFCENYQYMIMRLSIAITILDIFKEAIVIVITYLRFRQPTTNSDSRMNTIFHSIINYIFLAITFTIFICYRIATRFIVVKILIKITYFKLIIQIHQENWIRISRANWKVSRIIIIYRTSTCFIICNEK